MHTPRRPASWTPAEKPTILFDELQARYGFLGGSYNEYVLYHFREEARPLWRSVTAEHVKGIAGFSVVPKKDGRQRKLLIHVATNS